MPLVGTRLMRKKSIRIRYQYEARRKKNDMHYALRDATIVLAPTIRIILRSDEESFERRARVCRNIPVSIFRRVELCKSHTSRLMTSPLFLLHTFIAKQLKIRSKAA